MGAKRLGLTSKALQVLLTRIGSASSGTKSKLFERFVRDVQRPSLLQDKLSRSDEQPQRMLRLVSIDMGIKNLAFCDAEVSFPAAKTNTGDRDRLNSTVNVLRWKKIDLMHGNYKESCRDATEDAEANTNVAEDDADQFSPAVLSQTAYRVITEEVLSVNPDIVLIEKQRWRSGGGSAVQQWTLRVNSLEAMFWAILETLKREQRSCGPVGNFTDTQEPWQTYAVDPKRVGQYWLSQHARALEERDQETLAVDMSKLSNVVEEADDLEEEEKNGKAKKKPSRSKAEKSAKIAVLRSWLVNDTMSTLPSTPSETPHISFNIAADAEGPLQALLPKNKGTRRKKSSKATKDAELTEELPATEIKKLDDITDCFLQAAAWIAWESNRVQLMGAPFDMFKDGKIDLTRTPHKPLTEGEIDTVKLMKRLGDFEFSFEVPESSDPFRR